LQRNYDIQKPETYQFLTVFCTPKLKIVKLDGRASQLTTAIPIVMRTVEIINCFFSPGSISLTSLISKKSVANSVVIKQTMIPMELMRSGYSMPVRSWLMPKEEIEATTNAAHEDSA
jgi:hypothetical protein